MSEPIATGDTVVMRLAGELDLANSWQLRRRLLAVISPDIRAVALDVADIAFIDSSGLGTLIGLAHELRGRSVSLVVRNPSIATRRLLRVAALDDQTFGIEPSP